MYIFTEHRLRVNYRKKCVDTYFARLGEIQVVHDVYKLIHAFGQARVEPALFTDRRRRLT